MPAHGNADSRAAREQEAQLIGVEVPDDVCCARLAQAWERAGDGERARCWALRTCGGGYRFTAWASAARTLRKVGAGASPSLKVGLLGTANLTPLATCLDLSLHSKGVEPVVYEAPYGQYWQEAVDPTSGLRTFEPDVVVLVPDHHALPRVVAAEDPERWLDEQIDRWTGVWAQLRSWTDADLVQVGFVAPADDPLGDLARTIPGSNRSLVLDLDRALARAAGEARVGYVDAETIASAVGKRQWFDPRYWHAAKHAVSMAVVPVLASHIAGVINARRGGTRKVVVIDLDNTIWGGVIGEDGMGGIVLDGPTGEAHRDFQAALKELTKRGIVLAVCSKNDEAIAKEPFERHPDMVLGLDDLGAFVASWDPKPVNMRRIAEQLSLGLDAMVFVDDNVAEREAIRLALPEVDVVALPDDVTEWRSALFAHPSLQPAVLTDEDRHRTELYQARAAAQRVSTGSESLEDFQRSLDMVATVGAVNEIDFDRVVQLIGKTNQFNVTTRRHSAEVVRRMLSDERWSCSTFRLTDRFTDHGLVAVALAFQSGDVLEVDTFLMSCRVIGRGLEIVVRENLIKECRRRRLRAVRGHYVPTERNALVENLWTDLGFDPVGVAADGSAHYELSVAEGLSARNAPMAVHWSTST